MARMEEFFDTPALEAYGMTEASHQISANPLPPAERRPGSVGKGAGVDIAIFADDGSPMEAGKVGEVCIAGPNVVEKYDDDSQINAAAFFGRWFRTGDQGRLDRDGYLVLAGRIKELINRGGEKIAPREIDEVLLAHPKVNEAVCFGMSHPIWGEEVAAAVIPRETVSEGDLMSWCSEHLVGYKCPKKIYMVSTIPRTPTGKIQRLTVAAALTARAASSNG